MPKYFNTQFGPVRYNEDGQTVAGFDWVESEETPEIKTALERQELIKVDSDENIIYDSNEEPDTSAGDFSPNEQDDNSEKLEG